MDLLQINGLSKTYRGSETAALSDFTYHFDEGIYGLLGPNGAGKSTLMNLIVGNLLPDQGEILFQGSPIQSLGSSYRADLGYMPQQQQLSSGFTVQRFMYYFAALKGLHAKEAGERIPNLLNTVGLYEKANVRLSKLSGGMKQRVLLAAALLNDPKLLILDEPTAGLDPKERMNFRNYLYSIASDKTILLATHVISDIEQIAREVIFLKNGRIILSGRPEDTIASVSVNWWEAEVNKKDYGDLLVQYPHSHVTGERDDIVSLKIISQEKPRIKGTKAAVVNLEDVYVFLYTIEVENGNGRYYHSLGVNSLI